MDGSSDGLKSHWLKHVSCPDYDKNKLEKSRAGISFTKKIARVNSFVQTAETY